MPPADDSAAGRQRRVDVRIKVNLKYPDRETFVARFSQNLSRTGIFIRASDPAPVGSRIHFEYRLRDESRILRGIGIVRWARRPDDTAESDQPPGMGLEFIDLDPQSDQLIHEIVARHGEGIRAPQRRKKTPAAPTPAPDATAPALSLEDASLDPEEEDALDALLGGDAFGETPAPAADAAETAEGGAVAEINVDTEAEVEIEALVDLDADAEVELQAPEGEIEPTTPEVEIETDVEAEVVEAEVEVDVEAEVVEAEVEVDVDAEVVEAEVEVDVEAEVVEAEVEVDVEAEVEVEANSEPTTESADAGIAVDEEPPPSPPPPRVPDESVLAEFDDIDYEDEAPRRPASGDQALEELAAADEDTLADFDDDFGEPATDADWVLDLSGAALVASPLTAEGEPADVKLAGVDGRLVASADGTPVRNLIGWAGRPWPSAYALAAARRNGITLADTEEQVVMTLGDVTVPVWDAVDALIDQATAAFASSPPATVHVVVPSSTSEAVRDMLHDRLAALGVTTVSLVPDALLLLAGVGARLEPGHWGLIANIGTSETRVVLVRGPDEIMTTHAAPDLGLVETDRAMAERCAAQFLRQHELDVEDDTSLRNNLRQRVAELRRSGATTWDITIAGATINVSAEMLDRWTLPWRERIAITCEALLSTHGGDLAAPSAVVVATEEAAWPRLAETLTDLLGAETLIAEPGHSGRRRGIK